MATISVDVTEENLKDLVITAIEGGVTGVWAKIRNYNPNAGTVEVFEPDDSKLKPSTWHKVSPATFARGLRLAAKAKSDEGGWVFAEWLKDRIGDAIIADVILQFGVMGEVVYG